VGSKQLPGPVGYVVPSVRLRHCGLLRHTQGYTTRARKQIY
jgi:hypothetical protein